MTLQQNLLTNIVAFPSLFKVAHESAALRCFTQTSQLQQYSLINSKVNI